LESFRGWLEETNPETLKVTFDTPQALLANLRSTPAGIATLARSLIYNEWKHRLTTNEWCPNEILCHLRDVEREVNLPRIRKLLSKKNPFLPGEVTDQWAEERRYIEQDGNQALTEFTATRKETLGLLVDLRSEWDRPARHAIFGPTDLFELVRFMAEHDRVHIRQLWKTIHNSL
jgi:hypothetical protein